MVKDAGYGPFWGSSPTTATSPIPPFEWLLLFVVIVLGSFLFV